LNCDISIDRCHFDAILSGDDCDQGSGYARSGEQCDPVSPKIRWGRRYIKRRQELLGHTLGQYLNLNILVSLLDIRTIIFKVQPSLLAAAWVFLGNRKVHRLLGLTRTAQ
jgi:hypothetical protein